MRSRDFLGSQFEFAEVLQDLMVSPTSLLYWPSLTLEAVELEFFGVAAEERSQEAAAVATSWYIRVIYWKLLEYILGL